MDSDSIPLLVAILLLVFMSGFFSATEMAYSTANRIRLKNLANDGNKRADSGLKLMDKYDRLLSTILIGNNIVNITASSLGTVLFAKWITGSLSVTVSTIVLTVVILIFGEITPKTIAKENPEKFVCGSVPVVKFFVTVLTPLNIIFEYWKKLLNKMFKVKNDQGITEQELITIVEEAGNDGNLNDDETDLIRSAIEFNDLDAGDILIPRVNMVAIEKNLPMEEIKEKFLEHGFSRLPVYEGEIDKIIGMVHEKDFYTEYFKGSDNVSAVIQKVVIATSHMKISALLKLLQREKIHLAIITDEYGGTLGMVTLEDILEELVGEIWDEHDEVVEYFKRKDDDSYIVDCNSDLEDLFDLFELSYKNDEFDATTVGGWVTEEMEIIPEIGDTFEYKNLLITITKTDARRVIEINVRRLSEDEIKEREEKAEEEEDRKSRKEDKSREEDDRKRKDKSDKKDDKEPAGV